MRVRLWLALVGASALLINCEALFGFRDLEVESPEVGGFGGSHEGGVGGEAIGGAGFGGNPGGFGGFGGAGGYFGGFGGELGGFGGFCAGTLSQGEVCTDDLECETCICEDSGDEAMPMRSCCLEICPQCFDCDPQTGLCVAVEGFDPPTCMSPNFCSAGVCQAG